MGLLDQIGDLFGGDKKGGGGGGADGLLGAAMGLVGGKDGLQGLLKKFDDAGLDDVVKSWFGKDDNKPLSADQVRNALGDEEVSRVAKEAGVSEDEAADGLAGMLPGLIDKITPDGKIPDLDDLKDLAGKFFGK